MWMTMLLPLITGLFGSDGAVGKYMKTKADQAQAKADYELQVEKSKYDYATTMAKAATEQQANQLASVTSNIRGFILLLINLPIIITCIRPSLGKDIFNSISIIPQWYAMLDVAIIGTIFGLPIAANWMSTVFSGIQSAWSDRQDKKIQKIQVLGESGQLSKDINRKEIFETIKHTLNVYTSSSYINRCWIGHRRCS
jgi:hypothetical protein